MSPRLDQRRFNQLGFAVVAVLATHVGHLPAWFAVALVAVIGARAWSRARGVGAVPAWIRLPLAALLLAWVYYAFGSVFGREPGTVLGCGLLALKLLETERARDARVALGFSAFVLMSALLFGQTLLFTALVCLVLVLLVSVLVALQPAPLDQDHPLRAELRIAGGLLLAGVPLACAAFLLVPRLASPLWGAPDADQEARTGLSETMSPGQITELLVDDTPAMRVAFDDAPPAAQDRYFRTMVLWNFDGTTWSRGRSGVRLPLEPVQAAGAGIGYAITLEPTDRHWLPSLDVPIEAPAEARLGTDHVLIARTQVAQLHRYRARSATRYVLEPELPDAARQRALALPTGFNPRTRELAARWQAEGHDHDGMVRAALDMFHAEFTYTLTPALLGRHSVDDFLFGTREGFCEHYSSAFVVLMRSAGIPARVVTGYQGGWWNASDAYLLVRQSDAHAWAEVWLDQRGWVRVDPTAAVSPARIEFGASATNSSGSWMQAGWVREMRNRLDVVNRLWNEGIIRFDRLRQQGLLTQFGVADANPGDLMLALSLVLAFVLLAATIWAIRAAPRRHGDAIDQAWQRLGRRLARGGIEPRANEGPIDLLARVHAASSDLGQAFEPLARGYVALRYGGDTDAERMRGFLRGARNFRPPRTLKPHVPATDAHADASK